MVFERGRFLYTFLNMPDTFHSSDVLTKFSPSRRVLIKDQRVFRFVLQRWLISNLRRTSFVTNQFTILVSVVRQYKALYVHSFRHDRFRHLNYEATHYFT